MDHSVLTFALFCIEYKPTNRTCHLYMYYHQVKIMIIYEGTNSLEGDAFLRCFSILYRIAQYLHNVFPHNIDCGTQYHEMVVSGTHN